VKIKTQKLQSLARLHAKLTAAKANVADNYVVLNPLLGRMTFSGNFALVQADIDVVGDEEVTVAVSGKHLFALASIYDELEIEMNGIIHSGVNTYQVPTLADFDFTNVENWEPTGTMSIPLTKEMFNLISVSEGFELPESLNGAFFFPDRSEGGDLPFLIVSPTKILDHGVGIEGAALSDEAIAVPFPILDAIRYLPNQKPNVVLEYTDRGFRIRTDDVTVTNLKLPGGFHKVYTNVYSMTNPLTFSVDLEDLSESLRQISVLSDRTLVSTDVVNLLYTPGIGVQTTNNSLSRRLDSVKGTLSLPPSEDGEGESEKELFATARAAFEIALRIFKGSGVDRIQIQTSLGTEIQDRAILVTAEDSDNVFITTRYQ